MASGAARIDVVVDDRQVDRMLGNLTDALGVVGMYQFLHASVGPWLKRRAEQRFADEGDDMSGPWRALEPYTQQVRSNAGFPPEHPINHRTGELERYITGSGWDVMSAPILSVLTFPGGPEATGKLGEKVKTAQGGATHPRTPPRPVIGLNEADLAFVLGALATHIAIAGRI